MATGPPPRFCSCRPVNRVSATGQGLNARTWRAICSAASSSRSSPRLFRFSQHSLPGCHPDSRGQFSSGDSVQIFLEQLCAHDRQAVMQSSARIIGLDQACGRCKHRTGIKPGVHLHEADARFPVAGQDGTLDRGSTAPARQQEAWTLMQPAAVSPAPRAAA